MLSLNLPNAWDKIAAVEESCHQLLGGAAVGPVPELPARNVPVLAAQFHPPKLGLSLREGQARMLHDLANIELQAMELGLRTLAEFPEAPRVFREELAVVTISEAEHFKLCLQGIESLGFQWGHWPVHCALWSAVSAQDSLLDRILIVHRYLEGSGLDAGSQLVRRLDSCDAVFVQKIVRRINDEEVGHVDFGSRWYREVCRRDGLETTEDFPQRMEKLRWQLPKRIEKINRELRLKAGFTEREIEQCEAFRQSYLRPLEKVLARG